MERPDIQKAQSIRRRIIIRASSEGDVARCQAGNQSTALNSTYFRFLVIECAVSLTFLLLLDTISKYLLNASKYFAIVLVLGRAHRSLNRSHS